MNEEIWKDVVDYPNYKISNTGIVKNKTTGKILSICIHKQGHHVVRLWHNNKTRLFNLYRLLAIHFIPNPENKKEVNHIDGNRFLFPVIENLEWITPSENMKHAFKNGLSRGNFKSGFDHQLCKVKQKEAAEIFELRKSGISTMAISKKYNISQRQVYFICKKYELV